MEYTEKGISRLNMIPVRASASDKSEMVTQLLFGDHYMVLEKFYTKKWLYIRTDFDEYEGWIDAKQFYQITDEYYEQINNSDYKISTDITSSIFFKKHYIYIVMGSILPITTNELFKVEEQLAFNGEAKSLSQKRDFDFLRMTAFKYLQAPYLWGGKTPFGIDCSGLTQQVFKICGYRLKRDVGQQARQGMPVYHFEDSQPGDLIIFEYSESKAPHVGIYLGDGQLIHASGSVKVSKVDQYGLLNDDSSGYTHKLTNIRRILKTG